MMLLIISVLLIVIAAYAIFRHFRIRNEQKIGAHPRTKKR